jgi:hypothetical protein
VTAFLVSLLILLSANPLQAETRIELFFRDLENGALAEAESAVRDLARPGSPEEAFLKAQVSFYRQDYEGARKLLSASPAGQRKGEIRDFEELVNLTLERTRPLASMESKHFLFRYLPGKDELLTLYAPESLDLAHERITSDLGVEIPDRITVEIYPAWRDFMAVSTLTEKEVRTTGIIGLCKFNRLSVTTPRAMLLGYDWQDTLAHEFTHYAINKAGGGHAPIWLHEGIAKYEEGRWRRDGGGELAPRSLSLFGRRLKNGTLIPFEKLHPSIAKLPTAEDAELAFAQVFRFVKFLLEKQGGTERLRSLLRALKDSPDSEKALTAVYGKRLSLLHAEWLAYEKTQSFPSLPGLPARPLWFKEGSGESPAEADRKMLTEIRDEEARGLGRIADLLLERGRPKASVAEYEKAAARLSSPSSYLLGKLALASFRSGDTAKALSSLTQGVEIDPSYPTLYVRRAGILLRAGNPVAAEKDYQTANALNPFDPAIHAGLLRIAKERHDPQSEKREERALSILGVDPLHTP